MGAFNNRSAESEAVFLGAMSGASEVVGKFKRALNEANDTIDTHVVYVNDHEATSNAYRRLYEEIIAELAKPEKPPRFSDPANIEYRAIFVETIYKRELMKIKARNREQGLIETDAQRVLENTITNETLAKIRSQQK